MNKKQLLALIAKKMTAKEALRTKIEGCEVVTELRTMQTDWNNLNDEIRELQAMADAIPDEPAAGTPPAAGAPAAGTNENRGMANPPAPGAPQGGFNPLGTYTQGATAAGAAQRSANEDPRATLEYRTKFMEYCRTGVMAPELRADAMTGVADVSAVIPSTILNEVIRKVTEYGQIFSRVRKLTVKGGVSIPILSLAPTATWIGETTPSLKQKVQANTNITFSYYGLECKVSTSLLADTVSLTGFENTITDLIVEAMVIALDTAIFKGDGIGKALGITVDPRVPVTQVITLLTADVLKWDSWKKKVFAKMPLKYKAGASFFMASGTFEGYIDGMVDNNGQPIGRVNYGITDGAQERFGGKEVIEVEDNIVANYDDAAVGDVIAVYCNLKNYGFNSNMQMVMFRYIDHDTNEYIDKAILIADGKLIDPNGVVIVKKGAAV